MNDKPYELSAIDFEIIRIALRAHLNLIRKAGTFSEHQLPTEDLIERFDNADNVWMEINV